MCGVGGRGPTASVYGAGWGRGGLWVMLRPTGRKNGVHNAQVQPVVARLQVRLKIETLRS
jgi:hypothetical protein